MRAFAFLAAASLLLGLAVAQDPCVANAVAETDPNSAVGDAISNAVAQAFTKVIVCEDGAQTNPADVSSLAISVAVAISQSRAAGEKCIANADAAAQEVGSQVAGLVGGGLVSGAPGQTQKDLADAWLNTEGTNKVADKVYNGELESQAAATGPDGCLDISSILGSTPTATQVGMLLDSVINEILTAVTCGGNVDTAPGGVCKSDGHGGFVGDCVDGPPPAETAEKKITGAATNP